jgi:hypothetical protein
MNIQKITLITFFIATLNNNSLHAAAQKEDIPPLAFKEFSGHLQREIPGIQVKVGNNWLDAKYHGNDATVTIRGTTVWLKTQGPVDGLSDITGKTQCRKLTWFGFGSYDEQGTQQCIKNQLEAFIEDVKQHDEQTKQLHGLIFKTALEKK